LLPFVNDENLRRRRGIVGMIKNCCFHSENHPYLLSEEVDILRFILYPLRGPEILDDDDMQGMHSSLHNVIINSNKARESDREVRKTLVEILVLLSGIKESREVLRKQKAYPIIREAEKPEGDEEIVTTMHNFVQLLMFTDDMPTLEEMMNNARVSKEKETKSAKQPIRKKEEKMDIDDSIEEI